MENYTDIEIRMTITLNKKQMEELEKYYEKANKKNFDRPLDYFCSFLLGLDAGKHLLENAKVYDLL